MEKTSKFYTAKRITAKNFKGISDIDVNLNNTSMLILGSEGAGKTNLYQLLLMILQNYPSAILKKGEEVGNAEVVISKDDVTMNFIFTYNKSDKKPQLELIVNGERKPKYSHSDYINSLISPTFSIEDLIRKTGQEQVKIIKTVLGIDTSEIENKIEVKMKDRTETDRILKSYNQLTAPEKVVLIPIEELTKKRQLIESENEKLKKEYDAKVIEETKDIIDYNNKQKTKQSKLNEYTTALDELNAQKKQLEEQLLKINQRIEKGNKVVDEAEIPDYDENGKLVIKSVPEIKPPEYKKTDEIDKQIVQNQELSKKALLYDQYLQRMKEKEQFTLQKAQQTDEINQLRQQMVNVINNAQMPVDKLKIEIELNEDSGRITSSLTYDGLPFDSDSINTGRKIAIAAKLQMQLFKPDQLAIIKIDGSLITDSTVKQIAEECNELGIQALFEITDRDDNKPLRIKSIFEL